MNQGHEKTLRGSGREAAGRPSPGASASPRDNEYIPEWLLYHGIQNLLRCDAAEVVSGLADFMVAQYRSLQLLSALIGSTRRSVVPSVVLLLGTARAFLHVRTPQRGNGATWVARLANERKVLAPLPTLMSDLDWTEVRLSWRVGGADLVELMRTFGATLPRLIRLSRRLRERHASFKALRVMELVGYYMRYSRIFQQGRYSLAVMSSHSNPHGIAFNVAARRAGVPVVLVTHGMPVRPVARLSYDLAVVNSEDARQTYLEEGCRIGHVLVHGRHQHLAPMPTGPLDSPLRVGVFLCKDVVPERLSELVAVLLGAGCVAEVLIRAHPYNMWAGLHPWIASLDEPRVRLSVESSVFRDIEACDIVLAGNTSVHVEALTAGRPSGYVPGIDHGGNDLHRFVARGLVCALNLPLRFDPDALLRFYQSPEWPGILRHYANVDVHESAVAAQMAVIIRSLRCDS